MIIDYKKELNEEQYKAVTTLDGSVLIIAGAGTGKTRTMVYRAAYIIEQGCPSNKILMLTFTNKAANEMKERVNNLLGKGIADEITACTFHSFCTKMLRRFWKEAGIEAGFTILSPSDDADIINMQKAQQPKERYENMKGFPSSSRIAEIISNSINRAKSIHEILAMLPFCKYDMYENEIVELRRLSDEYKRQNSMLNYDDLMLYMIDLLERRPDIRDAISNAYDYVMVDEYQDTNTLQDKMLLMIRQKNKNLAVVGDDLQSLYGFRGAEVQYIIDFPKRMLGTKIITLSRNYRSNQEILSLSNYAATYATEGYPKELVSDYHAGWKPEVHTVTDQRAEAEDVFNIIKKLHNDGIKYEDICILARNSILSSVVETKLKVEGLSYVKFGGAKFFDLEYVKTTLSLLRVIVNRADEIAWFRILKICSGIGDVNAIKLSALCKELGIEFLADKKHEKSKSYGKSIRDLYNGLKAMQDLPFVDMVNYVIKLYHDMEEENIQKARVRDESKRTEYLESLEFSVEQMEGILPMLAANYKNAVEFLDDLMLDNTSVTQNNAEDGSVVVSTIHSVKGLEYEAVIILGCCDMVFPSTSQYDIGNKEDNEELRCFYVAVTRAKSKLYLIHPKNVVMYGKSISGKLSHYLDGGEKFYDETDNSVPQYGYSQYGYQRRRYY